MSLLKKIIKIRVDLQNSKLNKSGKNKFAGFTYYELSDFLPKLNELMLENDMNDIFSIAEGYAELVLKTEDEECSYTIPFTIYETPLNKNGQKSMQDIQYLGALNTYYKRYLYLNAFGITDGEVIDSMDNSQSEAVKEVKPSVISEAQLKKVNTMMSMKNVDREQIHAHYGITTMKDLPQSSVQAFIEYLEKL